MEPAVPFALLGTVGLLSVTAWAGLAAAGLALRARLLGPGGLLLAGCAVLAVVDVLGAFSSDRPASDALALSRAAGLLLTGAGLYAGALTGARLRPRAAGTPLPGVVAPLAAAPVPAALAALAGVAAAAGAWRARRDAGGTLVALGLLASGAAAGLAPLADDGPGSALAALLARGAAALLVLAGLVVLARSSLLAKVVAAILAGVLVTASAALGVVGTTVARAFDREQAALVEDAAQGRVALLQQLLDRNDALLPVVSSACTRNPPACPSVLEQVGGTDSDFAVLVPTGGTPQVLAGAQVLSPAEAVGLGAGGAVRAAVAGGPTQVNIAVLARVRLTGAQPGLALVAVTPLDRPAPGAEARGAFVYGTRVDAAVVATDAGESAGYSLSVLVGDTVVATTLPAVQAEEVRDLALRAAAAGVGTDGTTVAAQGRAPTVHVRPVPGIDQEPVALLVLSREAGEVLEAQQAALRALLLAALVATALAGGFALVLGRRTVDPVRRLTTAAERVAAGDLDGTAAVSSRDEVGTLSRAFDAMTGSLSRLTGDLRETAGRLETVLASMSDGLLATDAAGRVTSINPAALDMAGLGDEQEALGRPVGEVVLVRDATGEPVDALEAAGGPDLLAEAVAADGRTTPVSVAVTPLEGGDGVVVVLRDTTREREVERMKTEFLSNVSHELRTPLTPIRGYADILSSRTLTPQQVQTFAGTILAESLKMNRVVDLLVDVAAIEAGRVTTSPRPVRVTELLDARLAAWRSRAPERASDLRRRVAAGLPPVLVDPTWVGKALDELLDNAVKHTPPGTSIALTAVRAPDGEAVRVAVRDSGPGIAEADQALLFTSFEQVDGSATRRTGGLGLGLSFVRRLAEDAGYPLVVTTAAGKGAEFALDLPPAPVEAPTPRRRRSARR